MRNIALLLLLTCLVLGSGCSGDTDKTSSRTVPVSSLPPDADNTARNAETPDALASADQGESETDIRITSSIRKSLMSDKSLSTNAHNVKVITTGGNVTLRGPVKNDREKSKVEAYAKMQGGVDRVDNMLEVEKNP